LTENQKQTILENLKAAIESLKQARNQIHIALIEVLKLQQNGDDIAEPVIEQLSNLAAIEGEPLDLQTLKHLNAAICKECNEDDYIKCLSCKVHIFINSLEAQSPPFNSLKKGEKV
jgi:uncharacterized protein YwlG (UPF0340 family)